MDKTFNSNNQNFTTVNRTHNLSQASEVPFCCCMMKIEFAICVPKIAKKLKTFMAFIKF